MDATTISLMNWPVRQPRGACLFKNLMFICAVLVALHAIWPLIHGNPVGYGLVAGILILAVVQFFTPDTSGRAFKRKSAHLISRVAGGHWRIACSDHVVDGSLQHAWYGWGWITLRIQPYTPVKTITVTVWRVSISAEDWHQLRVWSDWDLAMVTPPILTEIRQ